jgi:hypothetical protein
VVCRSPAQVISTALLVKEIARVLRVCVAEGVAEGVGVVGWGHACNAMHGVGSEMHYV